MRDIQEMLRLITDTARQDDRIYGAYLCGSRVNPSVQADIFQDYDVVYLVSETETFRSDKSWIDRFGDRLYMQYPEEGILFEHDVENCYGWLIQLADGNRLDLHVCTLAYLPKSLKDDGMYRVLLDKGEYLPKEDRLTDENFWVKSFTEKEFLYTCNEFWWCLNNAAKGLWRKETLYVLDVINTQLRPMLLQLLEYKIGIETNFSQGVGKSAKYMDRCLPKELWQRYLDTYSAAEIAKLWQATFLMCDLFQELAEEVAAKTSFAYDQNEADSSLKYLKMVYELSQTAKSIE